MPMWGAREAGGTKVVCAVSNEPPDLLDKKLIPTTKPQETLAEIIDFFTPYAQDLSALGIGSFGPVDVIESSSTYGYILDTPKPHWSNVDFVGPIKQRLQVPIGFDTDVNAAALGEYTWGYAQGLDTFIYLTVGTGIGGGGLMNGKPMHGLLHPEMGHILIPHDRDRDPFPGICPFHQDCLEGLASGVALERRWGCKANTLPPEHEAWKLEAHYLALALVSFILTCSPQRLILGGGVMGQTQLFPMIRSEVQTLLRGYLKLPEIIKQIDSYIVPPQLGGNAGIAGAFVLAKQLVS